MFFTNGVLHLIRARLWPRLSRSCGNIGAPKLLATNTGRNGLSRRCEGWGAIRAVRTGPFRHLYEYLADIHLGPREIARQSKDGFAICRIGAEDIFDRPRACR